MPSGRSPGFVVSKVYAPHLVLFGLPFDEFRETLADSLSFAGSDMLALTCDLGQRQKEMHSDFIRVVGVALEQSVAPSCRTQRAQLSPVRAVLYSICSSTYQMVCTVGSDVSNLLKFLILTKALRRARINVLTELDILESST